jgi:hypothetical protein
MGKTMTQTALLSDVQKVHHWRSQYLLFVRIYHFFEGFYVAGLTVYVLTMMANWDMPTKTQASVIAWMGMPLYLKMFPGLLSDRMPLGSWGRRKPYILFGGLLYLPGFALLINTSQFGLAWLGALLITLVAWMLVDTTLDALMVDVTPKERSGQMQSSASSSRLLGGALGSLLIPIFGPRFGWTSVLFILATNALIQSGVGLLIHEIPVARQALQKELPLRQVIRAAFGQPLVWLSIFFFLFFPAGGSGRLINIFLLTELGWNKAPQAMATYGVLSMTGLLSSVLGALLVSKLPARWLISIKFFSLFLAVHWILIIPWLVIYRFPDQLGLIFSARILHSILGGMGSALILALLMRLCPRSIEGFTFALMVSIRNFSGNVLEPKTATIFIDNLGLIPSIFTLIPYGLLSLAFLYLMLKQLNQPVEEWNLPERTKPLVGQ